MVKDCNCICKETKGPNEWKGLIKFKIVELDALRGFPGHNNIEFIIAKDQTEAIQKYYKIAPGSSDRILIYPEGCATIHSRQVSKTETKPMFPSSEAADEALAH